MWKSQAHSAVILGRTVRYGASGQPVTVRTFQTGNNAMEIEPDPTDEDLKKFLRSMEVLQAILMRDERKAPGLMSSFADEIEKAEKQFPPKKAFIIAVERFETGYFKKEPQLTEEELQKGREMIRNGVALFDLEENSFRPEVEKKSPLPN